MFHQYRFLLFEVARDLIAARGVQTRAQMRGHIGGVPVRKLINDLGVDELAVVLICLICLDAERPEPLNRPAPIGTGVRVDFALHIGFAGSEHLVLRQIVRSTKPAETRPDDGDKNEYAKPNKDGSRGRH